MLLKINKLIFVSRKLHIPITKQYLFVLLIKYNPTNNCSMISYMSSNIAQNTLAVTNTNTEIESTHACPAPATTAGLACAV